MKTWTIIFVIAAAVVAYLVFIYKPKTSGLPHGPTSMPFVNGPKEGPPGQ